MKVIIIILVFVLTLGPLKLHASEDILQDTNISQGENGGLQVIFDIYSYENVKSLKAKIWSDNDESKPLCTKDVQGSNGHFYFDVQSYDNINESSTWTVSILYENGVEVNSKYYDFKGDMNTKANNITNTDDMAKSNNVLSDVNVVNNGFSYTITAEIDANKVTSVYFPTWSLTNGQDDIIWEKGDITGNTVTYTANIKDHKYEDGEYLTHIYAYDASGAIVEVQAIQPQTITRTMPSISDVRVENTGTKYMITANIKGMDIKDVKFPTWTTKNGQDDVRWDSGTIKGDTVTYTVDIKDHNYEDGEYLTHIYIYDSLGNVSAEAVKAQMLKKKMPTISNVKVENTGTKYTITADIDGMDIKDVKFPTWTTKNGQDDVRWGSGTVKGNTVTYTVDMKDHNYEDGEYLTHIYIYDSLGNVSAEAVKAQMLKKKMPSINNIKVENTGIKYIITADIDGMDITSVKFPTWTTKNGQDDVRWDNGTIKGNKVTYTVDMKDHNYEDGEYLTHIYIYDAFGNATSTAIEKQMLKKKSPTISNIKVENTGTKYTITANIDGMDIMSVRFPTWTTKDGQDDVRWDIGTIIGNTITYTVDMKDHNYENGEYLTHIYAYDVSGEVVVAVVSSQILNNEPPVIKNVNVKNNGQYYTITATITDDIGLDYVSFPTWTTVNGQDDITWEKGRIEGDTVTYTVYPKDHNYETGVYRTHIYVYDKFGISTGCAVEDQTIKNIPEMSPGWNIVNGKKYLMNNQGQVVAGANKLVIDISDHNGDIDWQAVKNSGVDAVILRCGYGWQNDLSQIDKKFLQNAKELERLNIPYGVYLFSYENSAAGAIEEAKYTLRLIQGRKISLPVYYDLEYDKSVGNLPQSTYVAMANAFCQYIKNAGYTPGVYANLDYWNNKLNDSSLDKYEKWVAQYNVNDGTAGHCDYTKPYKMWQYTSVGKVNGISTNVDMNALYE